MTILIENLGVLKKAEFEIGDLTIICGENNTGKTYATYALFGFLSNWQKYMKIEVSPHEISNLIRDGVVRIDITSYIMDAQEILSQGCHRYSQELHTIFASNSKYFNEASFQVQLDSDWESILSIAYERKLRSQQNELLVMSKSEDSRDLVISLSTNTEKISLPPNIIEDIISEVIMEMIFGRHFPTPFIASAERTGVAIFNGELSFARNRLLEEIGSAQKDVNPVELLSKSYNDYAWPVRAM